MGLYIYHKFKKAINWSSSYNNLLKLQSRIVKQLAKKNYRNIRNLQRLILKNFSTRLIVSQKIIESQNYKKFGLYQISREKKFISINALDINTCLQFEKILDLNNIYYQLLSMLWVLALLPIHETFNDSFSYNYRLYRNHTDILKELIIIMKNPTYKWVLILKPTGFFSPKNQKWLLENLFIEKKFLIFFFKIKKLANSLVQDYKYNQDQVEITKISLTKIVKNCSLQGYESFLKISINSLPNIYKKSLKCSNKSKSKLYLGPTIYYNNLIIIPSPHLAHLNIRYKSIFKLINSHGLIIQKNRIWVLNLNQGFNFLGWFIKKSNKRVIFQISYQNIRSHKLEIKKFLKSSRYLSIDKVINQLNKRIMKWQSYYAYTPTLSKTWSEMNYYLFWRIWRWCKKRHKNKGSKWLYQKYWHCSRNKKWIFHYNNQYLKPYDFQKQKIIQIPASLNACTKKDFKRINKLLFQKYINFNK